MSAYDYCKSNNFTMVRVRDYSETEWILKDLVKGPYWIDAVKHGLMWQWSNGESIEWSFWANGQPDCTLSNQCDTLVNDRGNWVALDVDPNRKAAIVCEASIHTAIDATVKWSNLDVAVC